MMQLAVYGERELNTDDTERELNTDDTEKELNTDDTEKELNTDETDVTDFWDSGLMVWECLYFG